MIRQRASRASAAVASPVPLSTTVTSSSSIGATTCSRYRRSAGSLHLPASSSGRPAARHARMATSGPLSGLNRASHSTGPAPGVALAREAADVERVVHGADPGQARVQPALGVRDRHQARRRVDVAQHVAVLADRVAVHCRHGGHRPAAGDQRTDGGVVVDHVEVGRADQAGSPGPGGPARAATRRAGRTGPRPRWRRSRAAVPWSPPAPNRVTVVPLPDQRVHQRGDDLLQAAVAGWRHGQPRRNHHRDPQRPLLAGGPQASGSRPESSPLVPGAAAPPVGGGFRWRPR